MKISIKQTALALITVAMLSACHGSQPVYNVPESAVPYDSQRPLSVEQVGSMIRQTAQSQGWIISRATPGELRCVIRWQDHEATTAIHYTRSFYSIELVSSSNLNEQDGMIHRKYNSRVQKLKNAIDKRLSLGAF